MTEPIGINTEDKPLIEVMPYDMMRGQDKLKLALELAFIAPKIGGVLLSGDSGTGKSTLVRAFGAMVNEGKLPVTLPINATEDRVVGGWAIEELVRKNEVKRKDGLLEQANKNILYIDEVNLLDDRIVNIILDVASTGILTVQQEGQDVRKPISFTLVGTMNPSEGGLRPQLLDRFGLMVEVVTEQDDTQRSQILQNVLLYEAAKEAKANGKPNWATPKVEASRQKDKGLAKKLEDARELFKGMRLSEETAALCAKVGKAFKAEGHRADYIMALAAQAHATLKETKNVTREDIWAVAGLALQHRQRSNSLDWDDDRQQEVRKILGMQ